MAIATEKFGVEEINLMCIYDTADKTRLVAEMRESLPHVYEPELIDLMNTVIDKLERMTGEEFSQIAFFPADELDGPDETEG